MKRFLVFAGANYYPRGGWKDFLDSFDTKEESLVALIGAMKDGKDWGQILDTQSGELKDY